MNDTQAQNTMSDKEIIFSIIRKVGLANMNTTVAGWTEFNAKEFRRMTGISGALTGRRMCYRLADLVISGEKKHKEIPCDIHRAALMYCSSATTKKGENVLCRLTWDGIERPPLITEILKSAFGRGNFGLMGCKLDAVVCFSKLSKTSAMFKHGVKDKISMFALPYKAGAIGQIAKNAGIDDGEELYRIILGTDYLESDEYARLR